MFDLEDGVVSEIGCQQVNNNIKSIITAYDLFNLKLEEEKIVKQPST
jgi:hypothetical protein